MLTSDQKGAIAESAIIHEAVKLGLGVFKPMTDAERYDLIFDLRPRLVRVQCKWAVRQGDVIVVRCYSSRRTRDGMVKRSYTADEIDAIAAYCADLGRCYFVPVDRLFRATEISLRVSPTRNHQRRGIVWADDFGFESLHCGRRQMTGP